MKARCLFDLGPGFACGQVVRCAGRHDGLLVLQAEDGTVAHASDLCVEVLS